MSFLHSILVTQRSGVMRRHVSIRLRTFASLLIVATIGYVSRWNADEIYFEDLVQTPQKLVDVFTFHKNEGMLLLEWGIWHGSIFGFHALHVIDNQSDDPQTKLHLDFLARKGVHVTRHSGNFSTDKAKQMNKIMAASEAKFVVPLDVDEFIVVNRNYSFVVDDSEILSTFRYLPTDGRRYRMHSIQAMYCPGKDTNTFSSSNFSRSQQMTVFQREGIHLTKNHKTFFLRSSFLTTDQGNHMGAVTMDMHDKGYQIVGSSYFHSPDIALVHFGHFLPWDIKRNKMLRGTMAYGHHLIVEAGKECCCCCSGIHYCQFYQRLIENETDVRATYEKNIPCASNNNLVTQIIAERIKDLLRPGGR